IADGPPLCRVLVAAPPIGGLGWTTLEPVYGVEAGGTPARAEGNVIENGLVRGEVQGDGRVTIVRPDGTRYPDLFGVEDGGEAGDEYNYSPPDRDVVVTDPAEQPVVDVVQDGPVQATLRVTRRFRIPARLDANGRARPRGVPPRHARVRAGRRARARDHVDAKRGMVVAPRHDEPCGSGGADARNAGRAAARLPSIRARRVPARRRLVFRPCARRRR